MLKTAIWEIFRQTITALSLLKQVRMMVYTVGLGKDTKVGNYSFTPDIDIFTTLDNSDLSPMEYSGVCDYVGEIAVGTSTSEASDVSSSIAWVANKTNLATSWSLGNATATAIDHQNTTSDVAQYVPDSANDIQFYAFYPHDLFAPDISSPSPTVRFSNFFVIDS